MNAQLSLFAYEMLKHLENTKEQQNRNKKALINQPIIKYTKINTALITNNKYSQNVKRKKSHSHKQKKKKLSLKLEINIAKVWCDIYENKITERYKERMKTHNLFLNKEIQYGKNILFPPINLKIINTISVKFDKQL